MSEDIDWKDLESKVAAGKEAKIKPQLVLDLLQELRTAEKDRDLAKNEVTKMQQDFNKQSAQLEKLGEDLKKASKAAVPSDELTSLKNKISTLEQDSKSKAQFIAQLEQDVASARKKMEEVQGKATEAEDASGKIQELESQVTVKDQEIATLKDQLKELDDVKAELDQLKGESKEPAINPDFEKEKADFEEEKKTLFKEMEDFEVNLRQEMEKKDEKIKELETQLKAQEETESSAPARPPKGFASTRDEEERPSTEGMLAKIGAEKESSRKPAAGRDFAFPGTGYSTEVSPMETGDQRIVCPKCGNTKVKVESDRSRVLSYIGGVPYYAKKYACKKCMFEFRVD